MSSKVVTLKKQSKTSMNYDVKQDSTNVLASSMHQP